MSLFVMRRRRLRKYAKQTLRWRCWNLKSGPGLAGLAVPHAPHSRTTTTQKKKGGRRKTAVPQAPQSSCRRGMFYNSNNVVPGTCIFCVVGGVFGKLAGHRSPRCRARAPSASRWRTQRRSVPCPSTTVPVRSAGRTLTSRLPGRGKMGLSQRQRDKFSADTIFVSGLYAPHRPPRIPRDLVLLQRHAKKYGERWRARSRPPLNPPRY
eukprot:gene6643-biopygen4427